MAGPPLKINLIARTNGVGLDRDVDLVAGILEDAGHSITRSHCRGISFWSRWLPQSPRFDLNIFMERIFPRWISQAETNLIIPNQERFPKRHLGLLKKIDHVLVKSRHAREIFTPLHPSVHFTGFTSKDLHDTSISRQEKSFLHLAGRSTLKGTESVLRLWEKHPEWPNLLLLQHKDNAPEAVPENVTLRTDYIPDEELNRMMNQQQVHLCPSLSEGWGHYIVEAMACRAVVITTDGPPMNELITNDRGFLVGASSTEPRHLGTNFMVDESQLEQTIQEVIDSPQSDLLNKGEQAREWFLSNNKTFRENLPAKIESLCR